MAKSVTADPNGGQPVAAGARRKHLLLIGRTAKRRERLIAALATQPFQLDLAGSLDQISSLVEEKYFEAVLLDLELPDRNGLGIVRALNGPVIVVAEPAGEAEILEIVNSGAADFVTIDVTPAELAVRIWKLILNPPARENRSVYRFDGFELDSEARTCVANGRRVPLTPHESAFLRTLIEAKRHFATYEELIAAIWGKARVETQNLRVLAGQVRGKIEKDARRPKLLITVMGRGYRFMI